MSARFKAQGSASFTTTLMLTLLVALAGCGGGGAPPNASTPSLATTSDIQVVSTRPGASPFIAFVDFSGTRLDDVTSVSYTIRSKDGTASKPVHVVFSPTSLQRRGYFVPGSGLLTLPLFGLYADHANGLDADMLFADGSSVSFAFDVKTAPFVDPALVIASPTIRRARAPGDALGFDYFMLKSAFGSPVIVDSDGAVRWALTRPGSSSSSAFIGNAFLIGDATAPTFTVLELNGTTTETRIFSDFYTNFHHNLDRGKFGVLAQLDAETGGVSQLESIVVDMTPAGVVVREWDFAKILGDYMRANGDDPTKFIRPGIDWFHTNAAVYDPRDDSVIVSSRENFLVKVGYQTGEIQWIFGDPKKYWYTFPSLRAKALTLEAGGLYPIGQHSVSIRSDGQLMVFNNGGESFNSPVGSPTGETRPYSVVSVYSIDAGAGAARETWRYDAGKSIYSWVCSSVYQAPDQSLLINYSAVNMGTSMRLLGLDSSQRVVFDYEYATPSPCRAGWNAMPVPFENLIFD